MLDAELLERALRSNARGRYRRPSRGYAGNNGCRGSVQRLIGSPCSANTSLSARKVEARAFLLDEKRRVDRPLRVVEGNDQIKRGPSLELHSWREPS